MKETSIALPDTTPETEDTTFSGLTGCDVRYHNLMPGETKDDLDRDDPLLPIRRIDLVIERDPDARALAFGENWTAIHGTSLTRLFYQDESNTLFETNWSNARRPWTGKDSFIQGSHARGTKTVPSSWGLISHYTQYLEAEWAREEISGPIVWGRRHSGGSEKATEDTADRVNVRPGPILGEVTSFCKTKEIAGELSDAIALIKEMFQGREINAEIVEDPEAEGEEWVSLGFRTSLGPKEFLKRYREYTARWVERVNPEKRHLVRLLYSLD